MPFTLKIEVTELDDKSFSFKVEGTVPIAIQQLIATLISTISSIKMGPPIMPTPLQAPSETPKAETTPTQPV